MAWAIRNLVDGVTRQRAHDPEFDFDTCIDEMVALVDRATRKVTSSGWAPALQRRRALENHPRGGRGCRRC
jgi:hypothetical protein